MPTPRAPAPGAVPREARAVVVPRAWLIVLTVLASLAVAPWLIVGAIYWRGDARARADGGTPTVDQTRGLPPAATVAPSGRWGRLEVTTVVISPPLELVSSEWRRPGGAGRQWSFPGGTPATVEAFLSSVGLDPDRVASLMATTRLDSRISGLVLTPSPDLVRGLSREVRERLYVQLARSDLNADQVEAFRFQESSAESWLGPSLVSAETRRVIEPLIYRHGNHLYFADTELALTLVPDAEERRRLAKALLRQATVRVRLEASNLTEVPGLVEYWGRGGRRTDIRPLLESVAGKGPDGWIDIVHLLPAFARSRLYRFPAVTALDLNRPALANCLWTSLNFFDDPPDDRFLDSRLAIEHLQRDYRLIESEFELGDVVALLDERGVIYHTAVFIADGLVFTKNGTSPVSPWVILPLETVVDYYRLRAEKPRVLYHRRKDL